MKQALNNVKTIQLGFKMKKTNIPEFFPFNGQTCFLEGSINLNDYLHGGFEDEVRDLTASSTLKKLINKYGIPQCGRNRATFIGKKFVIKFPSPSKIFNPSPVERGKLLNDIFPEIT